MSFALSDYLEGSLLGWLRGSAFPSTITQFWVGLHTTAPADTGTVGSPADGTECAVANGYTRVQVLVPSGVGAISASGTTQQFQVSSDVVFPAATGSWGTVVSYGIFDSPSQVSAPSAPSCTGNTGADSSFTATQTVNVAYSWVTQGGETTKSSNTLVTISGNTNHIVVTIPAFPTGVVGANIYASTTNGGSTLNRVTTGTTFTTSAGGTYNILAFPSTAVAVPGANTSQGNLLIWDALTSSQAITSSMTPKLAAGQVIVSAD